MSDVPRDFRDEAVFYFEAEFLVTHAGRIWENRNLTGEVPRELGAHKIENLALLGA